MIFCFPPGFDASAYKTLSVLLSTKNCPSKHLTMVRLTMSKRTPIAQRPGNLTLRKMSTSTEEHRSAFVGYHMFMLCCAASVTSVPHAVMCHTAVDRCVVPIYFLEFVIGDSKRLCFIRLCRFLSTSGFANFHELIILVHLLLPFHTHVSDSLSFLCQLCIYERYPSSRCHGDTKTAKSMTNIMDFYMRCHGFWVSVGMSWTPENSNIHDEYH